MVETQSEVVVTSAIPSVVMESLTPPKSAIMVLSTATQLIHAVLIADVQDVAMVSWTD